MKGTITLTLYPEQPTEAMQLPWEFERVLGRGQATEQKTEIKIDPPELATRPGVPLHAAALSGIFAGVLRETQKEMRRTEASLLLGKTTVVLEIEAPRWCFYLPLDQDAEHGYVPSVVVEGQPGHRPTTWNWGRDLPLAQELTRGRNAAIGITEAEAAEIISSSMAASRAAGKAEE